MPAPTVTRRYPPRRTFIEKHRWIADVAALTEGEGCVDWPWSVDGRGYAQTWDGTRVRKVGHLVLDAQGRGQVPDASKAVMRHRCDRPRCVAPWHLHWGTQGENMLDMWARSGRTCNLHITEG